jgi:hypothetical protein
MLSKDPSCRPNINEILFHLENVAQTHSIELMKRLDFLQRPKHSFANSDCYSKSGHQIKTEGDVSSILKSNNDQSAQVLHQEVNGEFL